MIVVSVCVSDYGVVVKDSNLLCGSGGGEE